MNRLIVTAIASAVLFAGCATSAKIPKQLNINEGAIVNVVNPENNTSGSGFFFTPNCVLTVYHFPGLSPDDKFTLVNGGWHKAKYLTEYRPLDMAIFKTKEKFPYLPLSDEYNLPKKGDTLYMISRDRVGNIHVRRGVMTGIYPGVVLAKNPKVGTRVFLSDAIGFKSEQKLRKGMSGGVLLSAPNIVTGHLAAMHYEDNRLGVWTPLAKKAILALFPIVEDECYR